MRCKQSSIIRRSLADKISKMQSFAARLGWFSCKVNRWRTWRSLQHSSGISLFASTSSTETDKTTVTSKHHFLSTATWYTLEHTASWSRHSWGHQTPALQWDSWWCYVHFCCQAQLPGQAGKFQPRWPCLCDHTGAMRMGFPAARGCLSWPSCWRKH